MTGASYRYFEMTIEEMHPVAVVVASLRPASAAFRAIQMQE
jgi:hypothetical protein